MAQISIINKSDVIDAQRFDAEYFNPEYLEIESLLSNLTTLKLKNVCH